MQEQAEVVRQIFTECLNGKSAGVIANRLNEQGITAKRGGKWTSTTVLAIIRNEKYMGDALFQKTYTDSSFNRHRNNGECNQYLCAEHHEPIISHEVYDKANELVDRRGKEKGNGINTQKYLNRYEFSGKIKCGECGGTFKRRTHKTPSGDYIAWCCSRHIEDKTACGMKFITDDAIKAACPFYVSRVRPIANRAYVFCLTTVIGYHSITTISAYKYILHYFFIRWTYSPSTFFL